MTGGSAFVGDDTGRDKLVRLEWMLAAMLEEIRRLPAADPAASSVTEVTRRTVAEVGSALPDEELEELGAVVGSLEGLATVGGLRVVDAQVLGWLQGQALQSEWAALQARTEAARLELAARQREDELRAARGIL